MISNKIITLTVWIITCSISHIDILPHQGSFSGLVVASRNTTTIPCGFEADQDSDFVRVSREFLDDLTSTSDLTILDESYKGSYDFIEINLSRKNLEKVPSTIGKFAELKTLDLAENTLNELPWTTIQLGKLRKINLGSNQFVNFPKILTTIESLKYIDLSKNMIECIPFEILSLRNLEFLYLNANCLSSFPETLTKLSKLVYLDLSDNPIHEIPREIKKMSRLSEINLCKTRIKRFPVEILDLERLVISGLDFNTLFPFSQGDQVGWYDLSKKPGFRLRFTDRNAENIQRLFKNMEAEESYWCFGKLVQAKITSVILGNYTVSEVKHMASTSFRGFLKHDSMKIINSFVDSLFANTDQYSNLVGNILVSVFIKLQSLNNSEEFKKDLADLLLYTEPIPVLKLIQLLCHMNSKSLDHCEDYSGAINSEAFVSIVENTVAYLKEELISHNILRGISKGTYLNIMNVISNADKYIGIEISNMARFLTTEMMMPTEYSPAVNNFITEFYSLFTPNYVSNFLVTKINNENLVLESQSFLGNGLLSIKRGYFVYKKYGNLSKLEITADGAKEILVRLGFLIRNENTTLDVFSIFNPLGAFIKQMI